VIDDAVTPGADDPPDPDEPPDEDDDDEPQAATTSATPSSTAADASDRLTDKCMSPPRWIDFTAEQSVVGASPDAGPFGAESPRRDEGIPPLAPIARELSPERGCDASARRHEFCRSHL
jgi:hypothetical protein